MHYYVSVLTKTNSYLLRDQQYESLDDALQAVSQDYLSDPDMPFRWSGYFATRSGELTWLRFRSTTTGLALRDDIAEIDILRERGRLERDTYQTTPAH